MRTSIYHPVYYLFFGLLIVIGAGACGGCQFDPDVCLPGSACTIDQPISNGDTTELIIHLLDELKTVDILNDSVMLFRCSEPKGNQAWSLSPTTCFKGLPPDTLFVSKEKLIADVNDFLYDGRLSPIIDLLPADTCKCDENIFLFRAVVPDTVNINTGIARGTSPARKNNDGMVVGASFNYEISLQPFNDEDLADGRPGTYSNNCPSTDSLNEEQLQNDASCRPVYFPGGVPRPARGPSVKVAIVDTGADPTFNYRGAANDISKAFSISSEMQAPASSFTGSVPYGASWPGDRADEDGNCFVDDYFGYDFINDDNNPADKNGHGTHMAYTVLTANTAASDQVRVLPLQFGGYDAAGNFSCDLFAGICAISYARQEKADVINLSWGFYTDIFPDVLFEQVRLAKEDNILVVTSAGNDNRWVDTVGGCPHYPSRFSALDTTSNGVVSVAALDVFLPNDPLSLAAYSNYGNEIDLAAPGTQVSGALVGSQQGMIPLDGTSMAAAVVTRRAAMLLKTGVLKQDLKATLLTETVAVPNGCLSGGRAMDPAADPTLRAAIGY